MTVHYDAKNICFWDELANIHSDESDYDLESYHPEKYSLRDVEISQLGRLSGKKILHLQCHIGLDSFALEKLGADVTAIDYSGKAIEIANKIKSKFNLKTNFYCASVYDLSDLNLGEFDIVFTSYGILVWLENLNSWANTIFSHLKNNGQFLIVDEHPVSRMFSNPQKDNTKFNNGYLHQYWAGRKPFKANYKYSYASDKSELKNQEQYVWSHSLSEIINSLVESGLCITNFTEYDKTFYKAFSDLVSDENNWWHFSDNAYSVPLMFSLKATKRI